MPSRAAHRSPERGFTIIECLVALVVLSVALAGMVPVLVQATKGNTFGRETTSAATWAQDGIETLRSVDDFPNLGSSVNRPSATPANGVVRETNVVDSTALGIGSDLKGIEVKTTWTDRNGVPHTATFFTVRAAY